MMRSFCKESFLTNSRQFLGELPVYSNFVINVSLESNQHIYPESMHNMIVDV